MQALSRRLKLAPEVDLAVAAAKAQGWTGADLAALLADAQVSAAHRYLAADASASALPQARTAPSGHDSSQASDSSKQWP